MGPAWQACPALLGMLDRCQALHILMVADAACDSAPNSKCGEFTVLSVVHDLSAASSGAHVAASAATAPVAAGVLTPVCCVLDAGEMAAVALKPLGADSMSDRALLREAIKSATYVWLDQLVWRAPQNWVEVRGGWGSVAGMQTCCIPQPGLRSPSQLL